MLLTLLFQTANAPKPASEGLIFLSWILAFMVAAGVLTLVIRPLLITETVTGKLKARPSATNEAENVLESLYEKLAIEQKSLEDLEYDREVGALADGDYSSLKERFDITVIKLETEINERELSLQERQQRLAAKRATKISPNGKTKDEVKKLIVNPATLLAQKKDTTKVVLKCSECATPFKAGDRHCAKCQAPLPLMCAHCGTPLEDLHKFCPECGTPTPK